MRDPEQRARALAAARNAILATNRRDGTPQLTPNWFHWDGAVFRISTLAWTAKVRNIRRDPRVALCIDFPAGPDEGGGDYMVAYGRAELVEGERVRDETLPLLRKYLPEEEVLPWWERINRDGDRVVVVVHPERIVWRGD